MEHHFIPQFYLRLFQDPTIDSRRGPQVWVVDVQRYTVKPRPPKGYAKITDYYAIGADQTVETEITKTVDNAAAIVIQQLCQGCFELNDQQRSEVAFFMALLASRVPGWRNADEEIVGRVGETWMKAAASHPGYFERAMHRVAPDLSNEEIEKARLSVLNPANYRYRGTPTTSLQHMLSVAAITAEILFYMAWVYVTPPEDQRFVTNDNPVRWYDVTAVTALRAGLLSKNSVLSYPIHPALCLVGAWRSTLPTSARAGEDIVMLLNDRAIRTAERYIFASRETDARQALELRRSMVAQGESVGPPPLKVKISFSDDESAPN